MKSLSFLWMFVALSGFVLASCQTTNGGPPGITEWNADGKLMAVPEAQWSDYEMMRLKGMAQPQESPLEAFSLATDFPGGGAGDIVELLIWRDRMEVRLFEMGRSGPIPDRHYEREISPGEAEGLAQYVRAQKLEDRKIQPFGGFDGVEYRFTHFKGTSARQVLMNNPSESDAAWQGLLDKFKALADPEKLHVVYTKRMSPGLEPLYANSETAVRAVWARGDDVRVKVARYQMTDESWRNWKDGKLGDEVDAPTEAAGPQHPSYKELGFETAIKGYVSVYPAGQRYIVTNRERPNPGTWICEKGQAPAKLLDAVVMDPVVSSDGHWMAATVGWEHKVVSDGKMVCYNLETRQEVALAPEIALRYVGYDSIPGESSILVVHYPFTREGPSPGMSGEFQTLDPSTGNAKPTEVDWWAVEARRNFSPLQATQADKDVSWIALTQADWDNTQVLKMDARTHETVGLNLCVIQGVVFESNHMWVDETTRRIYFIWNGHLFRMPLPEQLFEAGKTN